MVRIVYSILVAICIPFVLAKLWWRGLSNLEYRTRRRERLGFFKAPNEAQDIWIHAVSVGELLAAEPIIRKLMARYPDKKITVTTMTPTSSQLLEKMFGDQVFHVYAPYDFPLFVKAFLKRIRPSYVIIMETELWPNMIHYARKMDCPVVLANARLSERSARGYRRLLPAVSWLLQELHLVLCQFESDAERFKSLGISESKIKVTGSLKYDIDLAPGLEEQGRNIRQALPENSVVWVAASTHEGEDAQVLAIHAELKQKFPHLYLVLVPRHPERFESAYEQAKAKGFKTKRYSEQKSLPADNDVFVLDAMGQLMRFFAASDVVFIGGSLVEVGGHNPIEPGALGKPVLMGPHYFNFEVICQQFIEAGALKIASSSSELKDFLEQLVARPDEAKAMGSKALEVVSKGRGAIDRVVNYLAPDI